MIEAIITGIGFGLVLTVLTGPVFFALIKTSIEKGFHAGVAMALGVVTSDMVFIGAILFGSQLISFKVDTKIVGMVGSSILFIIGIYYIFKKAEISYTTTPVKSNRAGFFLKGFLMCIFNPTLLFHWVTVIGAASTYYPEDVHNRQLKIATMFITILAVQFSMDTTKAFYANKLRDRISEKSIHRLNQVAGIALIIAALILVDRLFTHLIFAAK
ncbi:LysE family translocator [Mucilaginibacter sp. AW1-3]